MTPSKAKGTRTETSVVRFLNMVGFANAERRALSGSKDLGDIAGVPSIVWEVKAGHRLLLPEWLRQTETERVNATADYGILVIKPRGVGDTRVGDWWAVQPLWQVAYQLKDLKYGG